MYICSKVLACVLMIVRNKKSDNRSPFPAQNRNLLVSSFLCIEEMYKMTMVGRRRVKGKKDTYLSLHG